MSEGSQSITFSGRIDEKGHVHPDQVNATRGRLARWHGRHVTVTVRRYVKSKTSAQLGYYFMEDPPGVLACWSDYCGYDPDEMHVELKRAYLAPVIAVSKLTGEETRELPSLADLDVVQMSAYLERCLREGRQRGIVFPDPNGMPVSA